MTGRPDDSSRVEEVFEAALSLTPEARASYLAATCDGDDELRAEVERLIDSHERAHRFFETPPELPNDRQSQTLHLEGQRIGAYEVVGRLGAGGMGDVYRARDLKLARDVAIKILPPMFTRDPERLARFEREARALAALTHPNIGAIYGVEDPAPGSGPVATRALVLELIEGDTLAERIAQSARDSRFGGRRGLPMAEALKIAAQIADALDAAQDKGIVHRDLKPANIKITPSGLVKVLDFGLAKVAIGEGETGSDLSQSPTMSVDRTRAGMILGTVAYMSPEQARGHVVDKRTDNWAFGCVLYEMLTGQVAFHGATISDTIAAILEREPNWSALPSATPESIRHLLRRCLEKDARQRLRDIGEARIELLRNVDQLRADVGRRRLRTPAARSVMWTAAAAITLALAALIVMAWTNREPPPMSMSTETAERLPGALRRLTADTGLSTHPALSPDGRLVAFASDRAGKGDLDIWVQQVAGGEPVRLTRHAANETTPTFSPNGTQIAFRSERDGGGIYVVSALGGEPTLLVPEGYNPHYSPDGQSLAYQTGQPGATVDGMLVLGAGRLYIMPATGGAARQLHTAAAAIDHGVWSPDSRNLLVRASFTSGVEPMEWWVLPLEGNPRQVNMQALQKRNMFWMLPVAWLPGNRIVFTAGLADSRNTWIATLSSTDTRIVPPLQQLTFGAGTDSGGAVAATSGTFALVFSSLVQNVDLWSVPLARDRVQAAGPPVRLTQDVFTDSHPAITADGATLVYSTVRGGAWELWARDMTTGRTTRVVSIPSEYPAKPVLSPDGSRLAFWTTWVTPTPEGVTNATYVTELRRGSDGTLLAGAPRRLPAHGPEGSNWPWSWSRDGHAVWYNTVRWPRLGRNHLYDVTAGRSVAEFHHPQRNLGQLLFSPDGRWLAFIDDVSESAQRVVVTPLREGRPSGENEWVQITQPDPADAWPAWSAAGDVIYFQSARDGFICIWAQRLAKETMRPMGSPVAVHHAHSTRLSIRGVGPNSRGLAAAPDKVVFNMSEMTGNIWMTEFVDEQRNPRTQ